MTVDVARPAPSAALRSAPAAPGTDRPAIAPPASVRPRLAAWLIDLALIALPPAAVAVTQARTVTPDPAAPFTPDPSWITVAGTGYRWTADGIALTAGAGLLAALIVLALIPANTSGWTPGLRLVRLRVITTAGTRAQFHHHLVRTVFGLVDLAPFAVPGLLGWYLAHRSPLHQRLGDRLARTMVVDYRHPERPVDPGTARKPRSGPLSGPAGPRPTSGPLPAPVALRRPPEAPQAAGDAAPGSGSGPDAGALRPSGRPAAGTERSRSGARAEPDRRWKVQQINAPAGPTLPILPDTVEVTVPAPTHRRTSGPIPRRGSPLAGPEAVRPATRRPDPRAARSGRLTVSVPRRGPLPGSTPEPELVPEWSDRWQAWVVRDAVTGLLFRHDAATGEWNPL